jgi:hypothetical protein
MKLKLRFAFTLAFGLTSLFSNAQCLTSDYPQWPEANYLPDVCDASTENIIAENCWTSEYSMVGLLSGTSYTFSSSTATDIVTVSDELGTVALVFGTGTASYTPTTSGFYRFYLHNSSLCEGEEVDRSRIIVCNGAVVVGCLTGTLYPTATFAPTICDAETENIIAEDCEAGQYSNVSLIGSTIYAFASSIETDYITISDAAGTTVLVDGFGFVQYEPTANEIVRFYTHTDFLCGAENVDRVRSVFCLGSATGLAGPCTFGGMWPEKPFTPACTDSPESIDGQCYAGEYSMVMLSANKTYEFTSSVSSDWITLTDEAGTTVIDFGAGPLSYTTGAAPETIRFYSHTDSLCGTENVDRERQVQCEASANSISEISEANFKVFPNPATDKISFQGILTYDAIEVVSIDGRVLMSIQPTSTTVEIDINALAKGTYFIRALSNGQFATKEFIKN